MENAVFSVPMDTFSRNSVAIDGIESQIIPNSVVQLDSFDVNNHNEGLSGYTVLSTLPGEPVNGIQSDIQLDNQAAAIIDSDILSEYLCKHVTKDASLGSSRSIANNEFQEQFVGGTSISGSSIATLLAARSCLGKNASNFTIPGPSVYPLEPLRTHVSNDYSGTLNSSFASSVNYDCDEVFGNINAKGDSDRFPSSVELGQKKPTGIQPYLSMENLELNRWISSQHGNGSTDNPYGSCKYSNELSLSLATVPASVMNGKNVPDQCSEITSGLTPRCLKTRLGSEHTSCNSKELSLSCGSNGAGQFSQVISASKYLNVIQEILAQIARYSLENLDQMPFYTGGNKMGVNAPFSSSNPNERRMLLRGCNESPNVNSGFEVQMDPALQKRALEAKKTQLLTLLQMVDDRYSQCLDEIHTVISAFHAATELDPHIHTRFALQTISFLYKNLRERISNQILSIGANFDSGCTRETEGSFDTSYFQKQWTLQQLKKKEQQLWRPQRGLPERSVSVLRAWMFQNFLHPYPKDTEKHLLAIKSGLTRSQVSNWFINARVRLWKPMIEEMYAEMNRRKAHQIEEGTNCNHRRQISIIDPRFSVKL